MLAKTHMPTAATILIVEDDLAIAETIALVLEEAGFTAIIASRAIEGLDYVRKYQPDLITTDYMMPLFDGGQFIDAVRAEAHKQGRSVPPIIVISAALSPRLYHLKADAFLRKPFDISELLALIWRFLPDTMAHDAP
jgi:DNA-binding response OmpR family regulator